MKQNTTFHTADGRPLPTSLKLVFTNAARIPAVNDMFNPANKLKIDPQDYVVKRETSLFNKQMSNGHGTLLVDNKGSAFALTMAWHTTANDNKNKPYHRYTEMGTTLTSMAGFHSAQAVVAALALHQWLNHNPKNKIVAEILEENIASQKLFSDTLQWSIVKRKATTKDISDRCNTNVVEDNNGGKPHHWFECKKESIAAMARAILNIADRGTLNRKDGHSIAIDLSALDDVGLTRPRLEAMASGITAKRALRGIAP
jgi:hypothetical protein